MNPLEQLQLLAIRERVRHPVVKEDKPVNEMDLIEWTQTDKVEKYTPLVPTEVIGDSSHHISIKNKLQAFRLQPVDAIEGQCYLDGGECINIHSYTNCYKCRGNQSLDAIRLIRLSDKQ
jgi:hypothetical protein